MRRNVDAWAAAGSDLAIISIRKTDPPDTIGRVAEALA